MIAVIVHYIVEEALAETEMFLTFNFYCDECEDEVEELFEYDGEQICQDCLISTVPKIKLEDYIESDY